MRTVAPAIGSSEPCARTMPRIAAASGGAIANRRANNGIIASSPRPSGGAAACGQHDLGPRRGRPGVRTRSAPPLFTRSVTPSTSSVARSTAAGSASRISPDCGPTIASRPGAERKVAPAAAPVARTSTSAPSHSRTRIRTSAPGRSTAIVTAPASAATSSTASGAAGAETAGGASVGGASGAGVRTADHARTSQSRTGEAGMAAAAPAAASSTSAAAHAARRRGARAGGSSSGGSKTTSPLSKRSRILSHAPAGAGMGSVTAARAARRTSRTQASRSRHRAHNAQVRRRAPALRPVEPGGVERCQRARCDVHHRVISRRRCLHARESRCAEFAAVMPSMPPISSCE